MPADTALQSADSPEESASKGDYTLLALLGERPQVLTLLLWSLVDKRDEYPKRVIVLTTAHGERHLRAKLLEDDSYRGSRIENQGNRWGTFCRKVLGCDPLKPDEDIEVPTDLEGNKVKDVEDGGDEQLFASWCYDLVRSLTQETEGPLYGLIAGGRKTMTPDITTAFSLYGLRDDKLFHVIVPKRLERKREFFWPCADWGHDEYADDVHLVQKPFLHLQIRLEDLLSDVDGLDRRSHHEELLDELAADRQALAEPQKVTLRLEKAPVEVRDRNRRVSDSTLAVFHATGERLTKVHLALKPLITLLVLWNQIWSPGERKYVSRADLKTEKVDEERKKLYEIFLGSEPVTSSKANKSEWVRWNSKSYYESPCSSAVSDLKTKAMKQKAILERYFLVSGRRKPPNIDEKPVYAFPGSLPEDIKLEIEVVPDGCGQLRKLANEEGWPLDNLPVPGVVDD